MIREIKNSRSDTFDFRVRHEGKICFQKLDRKSKKLTFRIQYFDEKNSRTASKDSLDAIIDDLVSISSKLDEVSYNIAAQSDVEKQHFEGKIRSFFPCSHPERCQYSDSHVFPQVCARTRHLRWAGLLHHAVLQFEEEDQWQ